MQALVRWWQQWTSRSVGQAWGLAPHGVAWVLVGLSRHNRDLARVDATVPLEAPVGLGLNDQAWLSQALRQNGRLLGGARHRLNMALPASHLQEGVMDLPAQLPAQEWLYEVQMEVSEALKLSPDEVNFDFEPAPLSDGLVQRVHWMACAKAHMLEFKDCIRAAGWRLASVESQTQAAWRGVHALQGGVSSLLAQAPQDWQFRLPTEDSFSVDAGPCDADTAIDEVIRQVLSTPTGARLVASGLALRAWH